MCYLLAYDAYMQSSRALKMAHGRLGVGPKLLAETLTVTGGCEKFSIGVCALMEDVGDAIRSSKESTIEPM